MYKRFAASLLAALSMASAIPLPAQAHGDASALSAVSALPVASVAVAAGASAGALVAAPASSCPWPARQSPSSPTHWAKRCCTTNG